MLATMTTDVIALAKNLLSCPSITPEDANCQKIIADFLAPLGFKIESLPFGPVKNLWAKQGKNEPTLVFIGHTDVVPPGDLTKWQFPPFQPTIHEGKLFARGSADMKSSIAAMMMATQRFLTEKPNHAGSIAFLITSDEEGKAVDGTQKVVEHLMTRNEKITWCLVGEASCEKLFGDTIKIGRRGSLNAELTIYGTQGHIAYPERAQNPIHTALPALAELTQTQWDDGDALFAPTQLQISNLNSGIGATNVIPAEAKIIFNFRYSPASTVEALQNKVREILRKHNLHYQITWQESAKPFYTKNSQLAKCLTESIQNVTGVDPILSTSGGTSDGRFLAPMGCEIAEFGLCNETIHQVNEHITVQSLEQLTEIYYQTLLRLF